MGGFEWPCQSCFDNFDYLEVTPETTLPFDPRRKEFYNVLRFSNGAMACRHPLAAPGTSHAAVSACYNCKASQKVCTPMDVGLTHIFMKTLGTRFRVEAGLNVLASSASIETRGRVTFEVSHILDKMVSPFYLSFVAPFF
jgi:hypothetical protein